MKNDEKYKQHSRGSDPKLFTQNISFNQSYTILSLLVFICKHLQPSKSIVQRSVYAFKTY